jgi:hypothetical protein
MHNASITKVQHNGAQGNFRLPVLPQHAEQADSTRHSLSNSSPVRTRFKKPVKGILPITEDNGKNTYGKLSLKKVKCNTSDTPRACA